MRSSPSSRYEPDAASVRILGHRPAGGLRIVGIPASRHAEREARRLGIPLSTLAEHDHGDITIDGADEVGVGQLTLLKGRGGALLGEKIVASTSEHLIIAVDESKLVDRLGARGPVAVEAVPFAWRATARRLRCLGGSSVLRTTHDGRPFITDGGHYILDCAFGTIDDPEQLQRQLDGTIGVVEHGLFLGMASRVVSEADGLLELHRYIKLPPGTRLPSAPRGR